MDNDYPEFGGETTKPTNETEISCYCGYLRFSRADWEAYGNYWVQDGG